MMIEKVMIQLGAKSPTNSGGVGGDGSPMMIEEVIIQKGPTNISNKCSRGSSVPLRQGLMVQVRIQTRAN